MHNLTMAALFFLAFYVLLSVFFANVAFQIDTDNIQYYKNKTFVKEQNIHSQIISDSYDDLIWFVQISDLHLSKFKDHGRAEDLKYFCHNTLRAINPEVVIASGDLTDAKNKDNMGSSQQIDEWIAYHNIVKTCVDKEKYIWLDLRGNHDNFNVPGWRSKLNYFRTYSIQGVENPRSYLSVIEKHNKKYAFLAVDACLNPGPKRPFNFIGMLTDEHIDEIAMLSNKVKNMNVSHTIWFGHYPTSCILTLGPDSLKKIIGDEESSMAFLCGHLHQMGGMIKDMYTLQKQGFLELELGDWKDNRMFRIAAIDHGIFTFIDVKHGQWPVVLVTNPKNPLYSMPHREPLFLMKNSTHIRILAFSISPIQHVEARISNGDWINCTHVKGPLYVMQWSPNSIPSGIHTLYINAKDVNGRFNIVKHPFSLDGSSSKFNILAKIVLMIDASTIFQCLFATLLMLSIVPLIILKILHFNIISGKWKMIKTKDNCLYAILRKLWLLASVDELFYPIIFFNIYLCFGPWCVGEIIQGHLGLIFSWGVLINGTFIPGSFTYMYGFFQYFMCQFPMILILSNTLDRRFQSQWCRRREHSSLVFLVLHHIPFIFVLSINMVFAYFFWLAYGTIAFVLGPLRTWSVVLHFYLWYKVVNLPANVTWEASKLWGNNVRPNQATRRHEGAVRFLS